MTGKNFLIESDQSLLPLIEQPYASQAMVQRLLEQYPELPAGAQISPAEPQSWLLVGREANVPDENSTDGRWSLDHLFLDQDGIPTILEVKRNTDSPLRREVVGQMLDDAPNAVVYNSPDEIQALFAARCAHSGSDTLLKALARVWGDSKAA